MHDLYQELKHEHEHWHKESGYHHHVHVHQKRTMASLAAIAGFALVLGFAHEEEFVILSTAVGGIDRVLLMIAYASAVNYFSNWCNYLGCKSLYTYSKQSLAVCKISTQD